MRVLRAFIRSYPRQSAVVLLALLVAGTVEGASLSALLPMLAIAMRGGVGEAAAEDHVSRTVIGALESAGLTPSLGLLLAVVVGGFAGRSVIVLVAKRHVGYTVARFCTDLRLELLRSLLAARWEYFLRQPVGKLANAMATEVNRASRAYFHGAALAATLIQFLVTAGVALWLSWKATLVYLACSAAIVLLLHRLIRTARRAGRKQTQLLTAMISSLADSLHSVKSLKSMAREGAADAFITGKAEGVNKALRREVLAKESLKAVQQPVFAMLVGAGAYVGLQVWQLPVGTLMVLLVLLVRMLGNVGKIQSEYQNVATCESAYWAVRGTIEEAQRQVEPLSGTRQPTLEEGIRLAGVQFSYEDKPVLTDLDLDIPARAITVVIGFSGAGKTTLLDLVIGLLRPQDGDVLIDGVRLADLDRRAWRRMIGYVPQETVLLHDSVLHNVTLGEPSLGEADAERALRAAGAWDFVASLPEGIHTVVGERGSMLSGGQRQRVMVARALVHEPKLLILDEATSALDNQTQAVVSESLNRLAVTRIVIAHRLSTIRHADRIYVVESGRIAQEGGFDELSSAPGLFSRLMARQMT